MNSKSGFSLVEILVVLAIFAILLSLCTVTVVDPPERSRENASAAKARGLVLACFNYEMDNGSFPSGSSSLEAIKKLYPIYLQDPGHIFLKQTGGHVPFTGTSPNVCWTLVMNHGTGLTLDKDPPNVPAIISDVGENYPAFPTGGTTFTPTDKNIWGKAGVTVAWMDQSTAFLRPKYNSTIVLTPPTFVAPKGAVYSDVAP